MNDSGSGFDREVELRRLDLWLDAERMAGWVDSLSSWRIISHLTFRWECSLDSGRRCYERFMRRHFPALSYFYAEEQNPGRDGYHVHALWGRCEALYRREAWLAWFKRYGRARIEPVRNKGDVTSYCAKYVTKQRAWWNVKVQWDELQRLRGEAFSLEVEPDRRLPVPQREFGFASEVFNLSSEPASVVASPSAPASDAGQRQLWEQVGDGRWRPMAG